MDRISNLPDSVLSHILSLLPTKLAASTCVLSKRWQFLWTMIYNLDMECKTQRSQEDRARCIVMSFVNFVNKVFTVRDKDLCIKRFRLKFGSMCSSTHIDSWVLAAIASDVEELDLELFLHRHFQELRSIDDFFLFHCSMFTCKTLVTLKLSDIYVDAPQSSVHFPKLKILHLLTVNFANRLSFSNFFYGCPVLEKLILTETETIIYKDLWSYAIFSPTLRELVMNIYSTRLWLEAPSLEYLHLDVCASTNVYLKNLGNLVEAIVSLHSNPALSGNILEVEFTHMVEHAFAALYNVRNLRLKEYTMKFLYMEEASFQNFPKFHNLDVLELEEFCCFWQMLLYILRKLPYLQHLTLHLECCGLCEFLVSEAWADLDVLDCFSHLRTLCFYDVFGWEDDNDRYRDDMRFLACVLKNSIVLEKMTITYGRVALSSKQKRVVRRKLASLERGSKKCQFKFGGRVL